ncbi:DUF1330 domain-containing protein [Alloalcanivorax sp. C16-2]|uniref:DUF1330 domain-containing protein n=1 Tax=Alloalcanivorax TaxID=3020832 RepID=UPI001932EAA0|nr:DUF1330 domain-containing protein [Alloalcanivorax marinus]MBL7250413.1 DUF1330 domain-containing protein [Alloalcanivorax marinus]
MKCYAIAMIDFTDSGWIKDYVARVTPMVERLGGRYLARTNRVDRIEGEGPPPGTLLIIEFPSRQVAEGFYHSEEYAPFKAARQRGSVGPFFLVDGIDGSAAPA